MEIKPITGSLFRLLASDYTDLLLSSQAEVLLLYFISKLS